MRMFLAALLLIASPTVSASEPLVEMKPLSPFIGTWTTVANPDTKNKFEDVAKWEWAFGGKVVRITHSVNQGSYSGESLIHWDAEQKKIIYRYVNNNSFYTDGTITPLADGSITVHEFVRGSASGPTETRPAYKIENGKMVTWAKFLTDGTWGKASHMTYKLTPDAQPIIKD